MEHDEKVKELSKLERDEVCVIMKLSESRHFESESCVKPLKILNLALKIPVNKIQHYTVPKL
jgi:hypothetical protein